MDYTLEMAGTLERVSREDAEFAVAVRANLAAWGSRASPLQGLLAHSGPVQSEGGSRLPPAHADGAGGPQADHPDQEFHDQFLKQGAPPIKLIRRTLLNDDGPLL